VVAEVTSTDMLVTEALEAIEGVNHKRLVRVLSGEQRPNRRQGIGPCLPLGEVRCLRDATGIDERLEAGFSASHAKDRFRRCGSEAGFAEPLDGMEHEGSRSAR